MVGVLECDCVRSWTVARSLCAPPAGFSLWRRRPPPSAASSIRERELDLVPLELDAWDRLDSVANSVIEVARDNDAAYRRAVRELALHPPHVAQNLTDHLVVGLSYLQLDYDELPLLVFRQQVQSPHDARVELMASRAVLAVEGQA